MAGARDTPRSTDPGSFEAPSLSLPKGGGAIRGIGEKFAANPVTGTGSLTVPVAISPGRANFAPHLALSYDSGAGNGPFGLGWSLGLPAITRKTDKGLPRYRDAEEADVFLLAGAEDLVPERDASGQRFEDGAVVPGYIVHRYRPRIEAAFARIERWTRMSDGDVHWRVLSRDNVLTVYGRDALSRIADPADPRRVYSWLISETCDASGQAILYEYKPEDGAGIDLGQSCERNRGPRDGVARTAQRYLKRMRYGNRAPLLDADGQRPLFLTDALPVPGSAAGQWLFEVVLDYGEHDAGAPRPGEDVAWPCRSDPFSTHRPGFELRSYRLCRRILMFHHFPDEAEVGADCLVRSTDFTYAEEDQVAALLTSVRHTAYRRSGAGYLAKSLPPVEFGYSRPVIGGSLATVEPESLENLPDGALARQWVDLDGEGLTGLLAEQAGGWFYKRNESALALDPPAARFAPLECVAPMPVGSGADDNARRQFLDLAGDGQLNLVTFAPPVPGFHERDEDEGWTSFRAFETIPNVAWNDRNLRFVDLTGDGRADILITENHAFTWYRSRGEAGFGPAKATGLAADEEDGPRVLFSDGTETIFLADLSGDGLVDLARIRNGEVCYWPNLGYGRFAAKVTMDHAPWFDPPDQFDPRRLRLADIDGSGVADIIYLGRDRVRFWRNLAGNGWSEAADLAPFAPVDAVDDAVAVDLLGNGTACLVWSSPLDQAGGAMRYLPLMAEGKPHLLTSIRNNVGAETRIRYAPSTHFYLKDRREGRPWITRLPFPVHVVERVETFDHVSRNRFVTRYAYHHGYFDGAEREFRGFGMVEQFDTEEFAALRDSGALSDAVNIDAASHVPPVHTRTWFHTGAFIDGGRLEQGYAREYFRDDQIPPLRDTVLPAALTHRDGSEQPWSLSTDEMREACRALKGAMLRQEVYALDGSAVEHLPYSVSETNHAIQLLQPAGPNRHAVFFTHARETIALQFERRLYDVGGALRSDPRIVHGVTLETDGYGNARKSATIAYGRRLQSDDPQLTAEDRAKQATTLITYEEADYTNAIDDGENHRTPLPAETRDYEIVRAAPSSPGQAFTFEALRDLVQQAGDGGHELPYEDVAAAGAVEDHPYRRLIKQERSLYRRDDLEGALPFGQVEARALPFETYRKACTPGLLQAEFLTSGKLTQSELDALLPGEGGYVRLDDDPGWWIPSGRLFFDPDPAAPASQELANARAHFFLPRRFRDPFGNDAHVRYDAHDLLPLETEDALANRVTAGERDGSGTIAPRIDYRTLQPALITDPNGNRSAVAFDVLGLVVGTAAMGKASEALGDSLEGFAADLGQDAIDAFFADPLGQAPTLLGNATTRMVYDVDRYARTGDPARPAYAASIAREQHASDLAAGVVSPVQLAIGYSDGFGREIQRKGQAEPGPLTDAGPLATPRWTGSGWTIFNNKGLPVRQYEPFFSGTHDFEFANLVGVSPILFYDPLGRNVATLHPDHSWDKRRFDPWREERWDGRDTVLVADPRSDDDAGGFFERLDEDAFLPGWHARRADGSFGPQALAAAQRSTEHAQTPTVSHFDPLGRTVLTFLHNRTRYGDTPADQPAPEEFHATRVTLDIEGNQREVGDARVRIVMRYAYDMLGRALHQASMEAGERWSLADVAGQPIRAWDSRGHALRTDYDALRRPTARFVAGSDPAQSDPRTISGEILFEKTEYGEAQPGAETLNLRGRAFRLHDGAGIVTHHGFDFKGNLLSSSRTLAADYKGLPDWSGAPDLGETFTSSTTYDALDRPVTQTAPDASVVRHSYNEAGLLEAVDVNLHGAEAGGELAWTPFVTGIDYDARGQRVRIGYGNGAETRYRYDPETFRLIHLYSRRGPAFGADCGGEPPPPFPAPESPPAGQRCGLQNLHYTYDIAGNIIHIRDDAQPTIYFDGQVVEPHNDYSYDAIGRLIEAHGREHRGQGAPSQTSWNDAGRIGLAHPHDGQAMRAYLERYVYDAVGNLQSLVHRADQGDWTRSFAHDEASLLEPGQASNRLSRATVGTMVESFTYDAHGNMASMPHLAAIGWDFTDQPHAVDLGGGGTAWYAYDGAGQRVRKVIDRQNGTRQKERFYLGGFEVFREYDASGEAATLERQSLHVMDDSKRIALVETRTLGDDGSPANLLRYQFGNHLGSASLELDAAAQIISYEEYHPYGTTAYQAVRGETAASAKRYRYTAKERDEETGLYYHGARYYAAWLARWVSCDPAEWTLSDCSTNRPPSTITNFAKYNEDDEHKRDSSSSSLNASRVYSYETSNSSKEYAVWLSASSYVAFLLNPESYVDSDGREPNEPDEPESDEKRGVRAPQPKGQQPKPLDAKPESSSTGSSEPSRGSKTKASTWIDKGLAILGMVLGLKLNEGQIKMKPVRTRPKGHGETEQVQEDEKRRRSRKPRGQGDPDPEGESKRRLLHAHARELQLELEILRERRLAFILQQQIELKHLELKTIMQERNLIKMHGALKEQQVLLTGIAAAGVAVMTIGAIWVVGGAGFAGVGAAETTVSGGGIGWLLPAFAP